MEDNLARKTDQLAYSDEFLYAFDYQSDPQLTPAPTKMRKRFISLDLARGMAITLMILSHTVKGLLSYHQMPDWGIIPIHLITKFSSTLFVIIFGISLSLYFIPYINTMEWQKKQFRLVWKGVLILFWYKVLTVVQMFQTYPSPQIVNTLLFKQFPDFVEVLGFYSICLLWIPFFLPVWHKLEVIFKLLLIGGFAVGGYWLASHVNWGPNIILKVLLVEHRGYFTFGQITRGSIVLMGLLIGDFLRKSKSFEEGQFITSIFCLFSSIVLTIYFFFTAHPHTDRILSAIAHNWGKHPPNLPFMTFSLAGSFAILGICLLFPKILNKLLYPISLIGRISLQAFIIHILVIFIFYRYLFDLRHKVTYLQALSLAGILITFIASIGWIQSKKRKSKKIGLLK